MSGVSRRISWYQATTSTMVFSPREKVLMGVGNGLTLATARTTRLAQAWVVKVGSPARGKNISGAVASY